MSRGDNNWIATHTGRKMWPLDPHPDDIHIADIAHALSQLCRYTGHTKNFYSVGEHSVLVSQHCPSGFELEGLLHDAAEAYFADVARPVKRHLANLQEIDDRIHQAVCQKFNLPWPMSPEVKDIDTRICVDEKDQLHPRFTRDEWWPDGAPVKLGCELHCWQPNVAEVAFIMEFYRLTEAAWA